MATPNWRARARRRIRRADEISGTGPWAITAPCGGHTKVTLHPTEQAARRVLAWLRGVRCGGRCQPDRHRVVRLD
jgi:xanthine/CO dehydrogenase XdhC/CoxF family maturation factor